MNIANKKIEIQTLKDQLNHQQIFNPILKPETLSKFKQFFKDTYEKLQWTIKRRSLENSFQIENKLRQILTLIKQNHPQITLSYLMKKISFIFLFINQSCQRRLVDESLISYFNDQIILINKEIETITQEKQQNRGTSFNRVRKFIRQFSLTKTKKQENKLKIEQFDDRAVVRQILKHCFLPFCRYILNILQDNQIYTSTITKDNAIIQECMNWKIINWAQKLCDITVEINRLGKYVGDQLIGVWVFMNYLISIDLSIYCVTLVYRLQGQCGKWIQQITTIQKHMTKSKKRTIEQAEQVLKHPKFIQLRRQMEQIDKIKEKTNFLYQNSKIQEWRREFVLLRPFSHGKTKQLNLEECVRQFIQLCQKDQSKNMIHTVVQQKQQKKQPKRINSLVSSIKFSIDNFQQTEQTPTTQKMAQKIAFDEVYGSRMMNYMKFKNRKISQIRKGILHNMK